MTRWIDWLVSAWMEWLIDRWIDSLMAGLVGGMDGLGDCWID